MKTALIDLSAIFRRYWHASEQEDMNIASRKTLGFVRSIYSDFDNILVCLDCPPYKRKKLYPEYKANRSEPPPMLAETLKKCVQTIIDDGWSVLRCQGAEADDIIATYCLKSNKDKEHIVIFGADKDLLQIALSNVELYNPFLRSVITAKAKLDVEPHQVVDCLALIGDKADNIPGVKGIGEKTAAAMLRDFDSINGIYKALEDTPEKFKPSICEKLLASKTKIYESIQLIKLDYNCKIEVEKLEDNSLKKEEPITNNRTEEVKWTDFGSSKEDTCDELIPQKHSIKQEEEETETVSVDRPKTVQIVKRSDVDFRNELEPRTGGSAWQLAGHLVNSGFYNKFRNQESILAVIMRGRSIGINAVTALEEINVIKDKTQMSAVLIMGLCLQAPICEYFDLIESTDNIATFATKRKGSRREINLSFTIEQAQKLGLVQKDNWRRQPNVMLRWRCIAALARLVYPEIVAGIYTPDEIESFDSVI